ncbi:hypothetical protein MBLNU457_3895t1 [Dothideomycetes sp. NU457]
MPLWLIFHPNGTFEDDASKEALATDITAYYVKAGLPAFYATVNFIKMSGNTMYVGGKVPPKDKPFIRISVDHIAVKQPDEDSAYERSANRLVEVLKPHVADKGYDWEFHVDETERRYWRINGMAPPPFKSEQEKIWVKENKAVPY